MFETTTQDLHRQITQIVEAGEAYGEAVHAEMQIEDERPLAKLEAIKRLMALPNELTGKPHSASSAEAVVETDLTYAAYLCAKREAVVEKIRAKTALDVAQLRVRAMIALQEATI